MDMLKAALPKGRAAFFLGRWRDVERLDSCTVWGVTLGWRGWARLTAGALINQCFGVARELISQTLRQSCQAEIGAQSINIGSQRKRSGLICTTRPASTSNPHTAPIHGGPDTAS